MAKCVEAGSMRAVLLIISLSLAGETYVTNRIQFGLQYWPAVLHALKLQNYPCSHKCTML